jgi:methylmalonyl-CoA mutase C-terminal domain/subunit
MKKNRILLAKMGLDTHDRGVKVIAQACKNAGLEVIYMGLAKATFDDIINVAVQEDVDLIGLSSMTGLHIDYTKRLMEKLKEKKLTRIPVILGGIIHRNDIPELKQIGINEVFPSGSSVKSIIEYIQQTLGSSNE